jgi:fructose-bisphosphate aldolase, class II
VLHGSSGVADARIVAAVRAGMTKINVSTHLNGVFTRAVRHQLEQNSNVVDSRTYLGPGRTALVPEVARLLALFADAGEAEPTARAGCSPRGSNASLAPGAERRQG